MGLGIHPDKTKVLSNEDKVKAKEITVDNIKIEVFSKRRQCAISWTKKSHSKIKKLKRSKTG